MSSIDRRLIKSRLSENVRYHIQKRLTHLMSGLCEHSTFVYVEVLDPMKICRDKDCVEKFAEYILKRR